MATQQDADRAQAEADERAQRRAAARERMVAQIGEIRGNPKCPWCGEMFNSATWELCPSLKGQFPLIDVMFGGMMPVGMGDHEATCPTCGFTARFQPKEM